MASKKKNPSFEIPDAVRRAGQSGWVYRTEPIKGKAHRAAPPHRAPTAAASRAAADPQPAPAAPKPCEPEAPAAAAVASETPDTWSVSTGVVGLGLHVAAVPLMVPLYVTAAISRKLGLLPR